MPDERNLNHQQLSEADVERRVPGPQTHELARQEQLTIYPGRCVIFSKVGRSFLDPLLETTGEDILEFERRLGRQWIPSEHFSLWYVFDSGYPIVDQVRNARESIAQVAMISVVTSPPHELSDPPPIALVQVRSAEDLNVLSDRSPFFAWLKETSLRQRPDPASVFFYVPVGTFERDHRWFSDSSQHIGSMMEPWMEHGGPLIEELIDVQAEPVDAAQL